MFPTLSFGDQEFTPSDLAKRSAKAAGVLANIGIAEGDTFAVMLRNSTTLFSIRAESRTILLSWVPAHAGTNGHTRHRPDTGSGLPGSIPS